MPTADQLEAAGYMPMTIGKRLLYVINDITITDGGDYMRFSHKLLDMVVTKQTCRHCGQECGHTSLRHVPALSVEEAIERGYLVVPDP